MERDPAAAFIIERVRGAASGAENGAENGEAFVELRRIGERAGRGVHCDLSSVSLRGGLSEARAMPIVKALGDARTVVDATAGFLGDAFLLAVAGFEVLALERSHLVYQLAADGLERAMRDARLAELLGGRLRVQHADAREWLQAHIGAADAPDAVVIDPMFPQKKKRSALPRKEMVMLREVVGEDHDAAELLAAARACARGRVVLKRGDDAFELAQPDWSIVGTTVRFDVWRGRASDVTGTDA